MRNIKQIDGELYTKNLKPGKNVHGEKLKKINQEEYRHWSPKKSKLASLIKKGLKIDFSSIQDVLYLGASTGTTISHLSDITENGKIYGVEYSEKPLKKLINRCKERENIYPILGDARTPKDYSELINSVDFLYQDVSQKNQAEIFEKNAKFFLKRNAKSILILKTKNIAVDSSPREILDNQKSNLDNFELINQKSLKPTHKDHWALFLRYHG
ncbi:fibrillarin [archaeon SCG-AAA382B04]|nr:fibrillarin [archaeon SCG-AAA382B04]